MNKNLSVVMFVLAMCVMLFSAPAFAGMPVQVESSGGSRYAFTNDTIAISSSAAASFVATTGYREITLGDPSLSTGTWVFVRVDGTGTDVTSKGFRYDLSVPFAIESSNVIYLQLPAEATSVTIPYIKKGKRQ